MNGKFLLNLPSFPTGVVQARRSLQRVRRDQVRLGNTIEATPAITMQNCPRSPRNRQLESRALHVPAWRLRRPGSLIHYFFSLADQWRLRERKEHDFLSGHCANVVMETHWLHAGRLDNHRL
jgi:hypothetical protein